jgi:hypothetical protein
LSDTRRAAVESAVQHKALKVEQFGNPQGYYDLTRLEAADRVRYFDDQAKRGISELDAAKILPPTHEEIVNRALSEGKPVPPEVLADYPELTAAPVVTAAVKAPGGRQPGKAPPSQVSPTEAPSEGPGTPIERANRYANLIAKKAGRDYGFAYLRWLRGGALGGAPGPIGATTARGTVIRKELHRILGPEPMVAAGAVPAKVPEVAPAPEVVAPPPRRAKPGPAGPTETLLREMWATGVKMPKRGETMWEELAGYRSREGGIPPKMRRTASGTRGQNYDPWLRRAAELGVLPEGADVRDLVRIARTKMSDAKATDRQLTGERPDLTREEQAQFDREQAEGWLPEAETKPTEAAPVEKPPESAPKRPGERGGIHAEILTEPAKFLLQTVPEGGTLPERVFRKMGPWGEEFFQKAERVHSEAGRFAASLTDTMDVAWRALKHSDKRWIKQNFVWAFEDGKPMPNPRIQAFADAWRSANSKIASEAKDLGVKVKAQEGRLREFHELPPESYVPHILTEEGMTALESRRGETYRALQQWAKVRGIPVETLWELARPAFATRKHGSLEHARLANLPRTLKVGARTVKILKDDPGILLNHVESAARRLELIREFGNEGTNEYLTKLTNRMIELGMPRKQAESMVPAIWARLQGSEQTGNPFANMPKVEKGVQALEAVTATTNLSAAVIPNLFGGHVSEMIRTGIIPTVKHFAWAWTHSLKGASARELRVLGNLSQDIAVGLQMTEGLTGKTRKFARAGLTATGFKLANDKINLAVAHGIVRGNLKMMLDAIGEHKAGVIRKLWGRDEPWARRYLESELGFSKGDIERMVRDGPTEADLSRSAQKEKELVNAINESPMSRPAHINNRLWRMFFAYSSYTRKFARTTQYAAKEAAHLNVRPLLTMMIAGTVSGEIIRAVRDWLKDRRREDENIFERLFNDQLEIGTLGMWSQFEYGLRHYGEYGHNFFADAFMPPAVDTLVNFVNGALRSVKTDDLRPLWQGLRQQTSIADIAEKQIDKVTGNRDAIRDRLMTMIYTQRGKTKEGKVRHPLDPRPGKENTARMLLDRWKELGGTRPELLRAIEKKRREAREQP